MRLRRFQEIIKLTNPGPTGPNLTINNMQINLRNMRSPKGKEVPNQFIIGTPEGQYFQSYKTMIAHKDNNGNVFLDKKAWDYSRTTSRYRNQFLGETTEQCKYQIEIGNYKLVNLN